MKTKIFLILAAVMGGAGLAAIGTAMLVQVFRTPATPTAPSAAQTAAYTEPRQPQTEEPATMMERTSSGERAVSVTAPDYLRSQSPASAMLQPAITTEPPAATSTQPLTAEPAAAQPVVDAQVAQSVPAESAPAAAGTVASSGVYVQDVTELPQPSYAPEPLPVNDSDSYRYFYQQLAPQGEWFYVGGYGYCWRPAGVGTGWRPYWDGHWAWSECGWTWVSSEPWGGSTYHYGRWMLTSGYGWVWVPGRQWAPAWVCWRHGPGFVGWAPLPPGAMSGSAFYREALALGVGCWTMVMERDFLAPRCATVALPTHRCTELLPRTTHVTGVRLVNNVVMNTGPAHRHMEQIAGRPVPLMRLRGREGAFDDMRTRVESGAVVVARPPPPGPRMPVLDETRIRRVPTITPAAGGPGVLPPPSGVEPGGVTPPPGQRPGRYETGLMPPPSSSGKGPSPPGEPPKKITRPPTQPRPPEPSKSGRTDTMPSGPLTIFGPSGQQPQGPQRFDRQMPPPSGAASPTEPGGQLPSPKRKPSKGTPAQPSGVLPGGPPSAGPSGTGSRSDLTPPSPPRRMDSTVTPQGPPSGVLPPSSTRRSTQQNLDGPPSGPFGVQLPTGRSEPAKKGTSRTSPPSGMGQPPSGTTIAPPTRRTDSTVTPQGPPSEPPPSSSRSGKSGLVTDRPPFYPPGSDRSAGPSSRTRQPPTSLQSPPGTLRTSGTPPSTPKSATSTKGAPPSGGQNVSAQSQAKKGKKPPTDETTPPPR